MKAKPDTPLTRELRERAIKALDQIPALRKKQHQRLAELRLATADEVKTLSLPAGLIRSYENVDPLVTGKLGAQIRALRYAAHQADTRLVGLGVPGIPAVKFK